MKPVLMKMGWLQCWRYVVFIMMLKHLSIRLGSDEYINTGGHTRLFHWY